MILATACIFKTSIVHRELLLIIIHKRGRQQPPEDSPISNHRLCVANQILLHSISSLQIFWTWALMNNSSRVPWCRGRDSPLVVLKKLEEVFLLRMLCRTRVDHLPILPIELLVSVQTWVSQGMVLALYKAARRTSSKAFKIFTLRKTSHKLFCLKKESQGQHIPKEDSWAIVLIFTNSNSNITIMEDPWYPTLFSINRWEIHSQAPEDTLICPI